MAAHCWHQNGSPDALGNRNVRCCFCNAGAVQIARQLNESGHGPFLAGRDYLPVQFPEECRGDQTKGHAGGRRTVELME